VVGACALPLPDGGTPTDGGMEPPMCEAPVAVSDLALTSTATAIEVSFRAPTAGTAPNRYSVRYHEGDSPITDDNFDLQLAAPDPAMPGAPGEVVKTKISGLVPQTAYTVAVRGVSPCNKPAAVVAATAATKAQEFTTLKGCFVATAAFGSPMASSVEDLRRWRDERLLATPAGQLFVASYYAVSPSLSSAIATDTRLRAAARALLAPLVEQIK
jgi:hypothetical protein